MTMKKIIISTTLITIMALTSACSTRGVVDGTVNTAGYVVKAAANGTIGAGRLVANGIRGGDE